MRSHRHFELGAGQGRPSRLSDIHPDRLYRASTEDITRHVTQRWSETVLLRARPARSASRSYTDWRQPGVEQVFVRPMRHEVCQLKRFAAEVATEFDLGPSSGRHLRRPPR